MKKPRSDAKLLNLPEEQMSQLSDWIMSGLPYEKVKLLVKKEFGIATSIAAIAGFYSAVCGPALLSRRSRAVGMAEEFAAAAEKSPGRFDEAAVSAIKQLAFQLSISPGADLREVHSVMSLMLKVRDQDLEERRVALAEKKLKDTEKVVGDATLSAQEKEARIKQVFGLT